LEQELPFEIEFVEVAHGDPKQPHMGPHCCKLQVTL
jgi:hypothetical protein